MLPLINWNNTGEALYLSRRTVHTLQRTAGISQRAWCSHTPSDVPGGAPLNEQTGGESGARSGAVVEDARSSGVPLNAAPASLTFRSASGDVNPSRWESLARLQPHGACRCHGASPRAHTRPAARDCARSRGPGDKEHVGIHRPTHS